MNKLAKTVILQDPDDGSTVTLLAGSTPPAKYSKLVTNPSAWVSDATPEHVTLNENEPVDEGYIPLPSSKGAQPDPSSTISLDTFEALDGLNIDDVKQWVGEDRTRATQALSHESEGKNRSTLIEWLAETIG